MKSGLLKISGTLLSSGIVSLSVLAMALPWHAQAAKVNAALSWEFGDYGSGNDYSYEGPRLDMTMNPGGSNWYFDMGYRNRTHDSKQLYSRADLKASYRFRFDGGWIQPSVTVRKDTTNYDTGSRMIIDIYSTETKYLYDFSDSWGLYGEMDFGLERQEDKSSKGVRNSDYLTWELEPGVRYYISPNSRLTLSYYNSGKRSNKGDTWGLSDDRSSQQARLYYYWKTPIGLTVAPYVRHSIGYASESSWYDNGKYASAKKLGTLSRYALQLAYPLTDALQLQGEYYREEMKYKDGYNRGKKDGKVNYFKLGVRATF